MANSYDSPNDRASILGPTLRFKGELAADEDLVIHGQVEGRDGVYVDRLLNVKPVVHLIGDLDAEVVGNLALNSEVGLNRVVVLVVRIQFEEHAAWRPSRFWGSQTVDLGLGQDAERIRARGDAARSVSIDAILIEGGHAI